MTSLRLQLLKVDHGLPALGSDEVFIETEGFDHKLPGQSNQLRAVKDKL